ncbi:DUF309 domain-containing protein [Bacteriovorax sp. Seq25_V]|uniref:DUF309 domain-containing protein n=1 Tax=Bacteriovorax sp. Seq25_V TaxID=1201288 RepID=UPI00038A1264|nr:DUF309 domain-containing protein [Bacteriovorax sp. Seq25_V]EQC44821.1 PF03745 domain protein [Bacteriovorax sp. Seq25_V]
MEEFGRFTQEHYDLLIPGLKLFNSGDYWLCHEEVEDLWMDHIGDNARYVFWVVIQIATSLYHLEDRNMAGASGMINKAKRKIDFIENNYVESKVLEDKLQWGKLKEIVKAIPDKPNFEDFTKLERFKFII